MSTGAIVGIVIGAIVIVAVVVFGFLTARRSRLESRRRQAGEIRGEARQRKIEVETTRAEADERAAQARRSQAEADELAAQARVARASAQSSNEAAERKTELVRERYEEARTVDPDAGDGEEEARRLEAEREAARR